ncbi:MAG: pyridoxal phosphate-dependent aminotransferase [candidate division WOR-3 bacterium]|nr:pyridoxal phosphate-dependent aminotransferase [candidate division WOR-3 bacterium]MDH5682869.1 pyridoxal phosphate-dependent aminotransferase [candidate division WOR-3 bacterium]
MPKLAERMKRLGTETAFDVLRRAKALEQTGKEVIHLEIGEPDFDTPKNIKEAAKKALDEGWTHYGPSAGLPDFKALIAQEAGKLRNTKFNAEQVVVTPGAKPIMAFAIMAIVDDGDEVIYPNPGFPIYESMIEFMGGKAVPIQLREEFDFRLDVKEFIKLVTKKTKMIIVNSPQNPTGGVLTKDDLKVIADIARNNDIWVLSDEVYSRIIYDSKFESIVQFPGLEDRLIILDGFSKTYAMTGWRLGYGIMPETMANWLAQIETNVNSCTASFVQRAGIEGLKGPQDEPARMTAEFKKRRDVIVEGLNQIKGISCKNPKGAFYVFPNIKKTGINGSELADRLLNEAGVACLSGTCFGKFGEGYIRFSYANSVENIKKALSKIEALLGKK